MSGDQWTSLQLSTFCKQDFSVNLDNLTESQDVSIETGNTSSKEELIHDLI